MFCRVILCWMFRDLASFARQRGLRLCGRPPIQPLILVFSQTRKKAWKAIMGGREGVAGEVEKGGAGVREQLDEGWLVAREGSAGSGEAGGRQLAATPQPVRPPPAQRLELSK